MTWVQTILTPIITGVVVSGFGLWILFILYKSIKKIFPNFKFLIKYNILRKKVDEKVVGWCMEAISKGMSHVKSEKFLLIKGVKAKKVKEAMYIYDKVLAKIRKGGYENEQFRQGNEQTKLPEVKEED